jgi:hypothetical protein
MKNKRWQALVMVAFAWVLWSRYSIPMGGLGNTWIVLGAYESLGSCKKDMAKRGAADISFFKSKNKGGRAFLTKHKRPWPTHQQYVGYRKDAKVGRFIGNYYCWPSSNLHPRDHYYEGSK